MTHPHPPQPRPPVDPRRLLAHRVASYTARGWLVAHHSDYTATVYKPRRSTFAPFFHSVWLWVATAFTWPLWWFIWNAFFAWWVQLFYLQRRVALQVTPDGTVQRT